MHMLRTAISTFGHVANASRHTKAMLVAAVQIMVINKFCALLQSNTVTSYTGIRRQSILVNTAPTGLSQEFAQRDIAAPARTAHCRFTLTMSQHKMLALTESITIVQQSFLNSLAVQILLVSSLGGFEGLGFSLSCTGSGTAFIVASAF